MLFDLRMDILQYILHYIFAIYLFMIAHNLILRKYKYKTAFRINCIVMLWYKNYDSMYSKMYNSFFFL